MRSALSGGLTCPTFGHRTERLEELGYPERLLQVSCRPKPEGLLRDPRATKSCDHNHRGFGTSAPKEREQIETAPAWHFLVQNHGVQSR